MRLFILILFYCSFAWSWVKPWSSSLPENSIFVASENLAERVEFWVKIYSYYNTDQGVFHLVDDPSFILGEIDLTSINQNSVLSRFEKKRQADLKIAERRNELITKWKISDKRKVRLQMGLKDRMQKAFYISGRYLPAMEKIFKKQGLPIELTRIVFVESSFNLFAYSKVGASGLWQIMPNVARPYGYLNAHYDKRNHPIYATELAAKILEQNFKSLNSWPLAITAYNHGVTGVKRMVEKNDSAIIDELIETDLTTASWGFASKNFYACFLAVLEVERNADQLFEKKLISSQQIKVKEFKLTHQVSQAKILKLYNGSLTRFKQMNPHLNWALLTKKKKIPAGVPLVVPAEKYHLVSLNKS